MEVITGTVDSVTYQSPDGRFAVSRMKLGWSYWRLYCNWSNVSTSVGEAVEASGEWWCHARFGRQFKVVMLKRVAPTSVKGTELLGFWRCQRRWAGLGRSMVQRFGERTDVLMASPKRLGGSGRHWQEKARHRLCMTPIVS